MKTKTREWIDSAGGPLVMMPRSKTSSWKGVQGDHYDEACQIAINDYAGVLTRDWGDILVFDGEPLPTTHLLRSDGLAIVRWVAANTEAELLDLATRWDTDAQPETERMSIRLLDEPYVIFDSGQRGDTLEVLEIRPPAASRTLTTFSVRDDARQLWLILHRFE